MITPFILPGVPLWVFWPIVSLAILILGISKSGMSGAAILSVPLMMSVMPVDKVVASMLPLLVLCDFNAIYHHRRNADWSQVIALYRPAVVGIALGAGMWWYVGQQGVELYAGPIKRFVGAVAILFAAYIFARERSLEWAAHHRAGRTMAWLSGVSAGFTTTIAHAAGPIVALYLFSQNLGKLVFVGTMAWTFMLLNLTKLPFYSAVGLLKPEVFLFDLFLMPIIPVGSWMGKWLLHNISESVFNRVVMVLAFLAGLQLLLNLPIVQRTLEILSIGNA
jgi:uncharacterized protein